MIDKKTDADALLAESTLCTVTRLSADLIEIEIGAAVLRLSSRDVASLSGTLQRVVRRVFVPRRAPPRAWAVIKGGKR